MEDEHKPLPWVTKPCGSRPDCWCMCIGNVEANEESMDLWVCGSGCVSKADAEFIVRACNNYYDMLGALRGLTALLACSDPPEVGCYCSSCDGMPINCAWCAARKVITQATDKGDDK